MDIEEDIKKLNKYIELVIDKDYCDCNELNVIIGKHCDGSKNVAYAIKNTLAEREEDKKRIKELEVLEDDLKDKRIAYVDTPEFEENYIPKQKVKKIKDKFNKEYHKIYIKSNILSEKEKLNLEEKAKLQECTVLMQEIGCFIDNLQEILEDK